MPPLPPPVYSGTPPPISANYTNPDVKDQTQQVTNTRLQQGAVSRGSNLGVALTTDSLEVPLEFMSGILTQYTETSRPTLMPLFRSRYVERGQEAEISGTNDYEQLLSKLSPEMQGRLAADKQLPFEDQDPNMIAFDNALIFGAFIRAMGRYLGGPVRDIETATIQAAIYQALPNDAKQNTLHLTTVITNHAEQYLNKLGPNDPSYDLVRNALNEMKETILFLRRK